MNTLIIEFSVHYGCGGLGDRLVGLVSAILLAKISHRVLLIRWMDPDMTHVWTINHPYHEHIHGPITQRWDCDGNRFKYKTELTSESLESVFHEPNVAIRCNQEVASFVYQNPHYPQLNGQFNADLIQAYQSIFAEHITMTIPLSVVGPKPRVALQLRAGDVHMGCGEFVAFDKLQLIHLILPQCYQFIRTHFPAKTYDLFFTSDVSCEKELKQLFKEYVIHYNAGTITHLDRQGDSHGVIKTLQDLHGLWTSNAIVFSWHSNFGRVAGLLSHPDTQLFALVGNSQFVSVDRTRLHTKHWQSMGNIDPPHPLS